MKVMTLFMFLSRQKFGFKQLENLIIHRDQLPKLSTESRQFVEKYHDHVKVARQYLEFWEKH